MEALNLIIHYYISGLLQKQEKIELNLQYNYNVSYSHNIVHL